MMACLLLFLSILINIYLFWELYRQFKKETRFATDKWHKVKDHPIPNVPAEIIIKSGSFMDLCSISLITYDRNGLPQRFGKQITHWMWCPEDPKN